MKKYAIYLSIAALLVLAACGNNSDSQGTDTVPEIIEVEILLPASIEPNEEVKIEALVTQGDEKVEDANEVTFEVWKQGQEEDHEMIEADNEGSGIYSITKTFEEEGFYYVVAHTTARNMHVMPRVEVTVGHPNHSDHEEADHDHGHNGDDSHHDHSGHEHDHESKLAMKFNIETANANETITLSVEINQESISLQDADVQFEVWHKDAEKHEYIIAKEIDPGIYEAETTFTETGLHYVQIHVVKDELHEHQLKELVVQ